MKRLLCVMTVLLMLLSLCACGQAEVSAEPDASPAPSGEPTGIELYLRRTQSRYNMEYGSFTEYCDMLCDGFYGNALRTYLSVTDYSENDREIEAKRSEYAEKYGSDWHYEIVGCTETALSRTDCDNFAAELEELSERAMVLVNAAESWSDTEWKDFAASCSCTLYEAKAVVKACKAISDACHSASVTDARELELDIEFTGSKCGTLKRTEKCTVYEVNGAYVSELLIDATHTLLIR